ncbi:MAG: signal recognition particle-docking protein FtsY [Cyanobacteria bacterium P01_A01_bin.17]
MVFNWFRRQFAPESPEDETPDVDESVSEAESTPEDTDASAEADDSDTAGEAKPDYLNWAKAAFENIQQQQEAASETPAATEPAEQPESAEQTEKPTEQPATISEASEETHTDETEVLAEESSESSAETEEAAMPEPVVEPSEAESPPIPEPEQTPQILSQGADAVNAEPAVEAVDFDEGFIWSAEVLAAQGRRPEEVSVEEITWLKKLRRGLGKTRQGLVNQIKAVVGQGPLNQDGVIEIETLLLQADVGVTATDRVLDALQTKLREETLPPDEAIDYLKQLLREMLEEPYQKDYAPAITPERGTLNIWLMTGVNGAGKTTTIGKITHVAKQSGYNCLIAAADTFRAAAVEQVKVWGARSGVDVIANPGQNTDPAAVVYDAIAAAHSRESDLLLVDTAGRLQNKKNLMTELEKVRRIIDKKAPQAKVESLLVLDATLGQNGLRQAQVFSEAAQLTGVVLTKLDGTAKGGVAIAVVQQLGLPIRFIGAGEGITDLRPFSSYEFVEALLSS